jgi:hypothetical protein
VGVESGAVHLLELPGTERAEHLLGTGEVGARLLDRAADVFEHLDPGHQAVGDRRVDGDAAAEVRRPGDAQTGEVAVQRSGEDAPGLLEGDRAARVRARDHRQQQCGIVHRAGHRALHRQRRPRRVGTEHGHSAR